MQKSSLGIFVQKIFRDNGLYASCIKFVSCNECPCQDVISPGAVAQCSIRLKSSATLYIADGNCKNHFSNMDFLFLRKCDAYFCLQPQPSNRNTDVVNVKHTRSNKCFYLVLTFNSRLSSNIYCPTSQAEGDSERTTKGK